MIFFNILGKVLRRSRNEKCWRVSGRIHFFKGYILADAESRC